MRDQFVVKDSGKRQDYESGMRRDVEEGKIDFTLALDGPMFVRYADHLTKGAVKYGKRNWQLANSAEEMERFRRSALRHMLQWLNGDIDEDHAAAVMFNINAAEYVKERLPRTEPGCTCQTSDEGVDHKVGAPCESYRHMHDFDVTGYPA